jgi:ATP-binding cassette subfamily B protein
LRNIDCVKSLGLTGQEGERLNKNHLQDSWPGAYQVKRNPQHRLYTSTFVNTLRQVILFMLMWLIFRGQMDAGRTGDDANLFLFCIWPLAGIGNIILSYREAEASLNNFKKPHAESAGVRPQKPQHLGPFNTGVCEREF